MSTVSGEDFNKMFDGNIDKLAQTYPNAIAIYIYREPWNRTLCYKVVNAPEEEEKFLYEELAETRKVWP